MLSFNITCPHCLRPNAVLEAFSEHRRQELLIYDVAFACRSCNQAGIAVVATPNHYGPFQSASSSSSNNVVIPSSSNNFILLDVYPEIKVHSAPDNSPERAAKFFIEAKDNFQRECYETSVMLCRKVLDIATREILGEESNKEQLSQRITMLFVKGKITEQMKDWAHIVRMDSNGAVHSDEEFTSEEASQMINFAEVFMLYAFTLPAMVTTRQNQPKEA